MRVEIEQGQANRLKRVRAIVRRECSIHADNVLNRMLDEEDKLFRKAEQIGKPPPPLDENKLSKRIQELLRAA